MSESLSPLRTESSIYFASNLFVSAIYGISSIYTSQSYAPVFGAVHSPVPFVVTDDSPKAEPLKKIKKPVVDGRIGGLIRTLKAEKKRQRRKRKAT